MGRALVLVRLSRRSRRQRARDEGTAEQERAELVRLAAGAEPCPGGEQRQCCNDPAEDCAENVEPSCVRSRRGCQKDGANDIGEARWSCVLERPLAEAGLNELEVSETGQTEPSAERQPDEELGGEDAEQPPPTGCDRKRRDCPDRRLIEPRRP